MSYESRYFVYLKEARDMSTSLLDDKLSEYRNQFPWPYKALNKLHLISIHPIIKAYHTVLKAKISPDRILEITIKNKGRLQMTRSNINDRFIFLSRYRIMPEVDSTGTGSNYSITDRLTNESYDSWDIKYTRKSRKTTIAYPLEIPSGIIDRIEQSLKDHIHNYDYSIF